MFKDSLKIKVKEDAMRIDIENIKNKMKELERRISNIEKEIKSLDNA